MQTMDARGKKSKPIHGHDRHLTGPRTSTGQRRPRRPGVLCVSVRAHVRPNFGHHFQISSEKLAGRGWQS